MGTDFTIVLPAPSAGWITPPSNSCTPDRRRALGGQRRDVELSGGLRAEPVQPGRPPARPVEVGADLLEVVRLAKQVSAQSNGAFDVTVAPLVEAWGFGPQANGGPKKHGEPERTEPTAERIAELQALVGDSKLEIDLAAGTLRKRVAGLRVDLSAIAKGHGCDRIAVVLETAGYHDYMIEIGGELRLAGANPSGEGWSVAIERPTADAAGVRAVHAMFELTDVAVATSGDYRNFWAQGETRYSHTIDPRTGRPITHALASVTVVHPESAALADAWATALDVLGPEEGLAVAEQLDLAAYFLIRGDTGFEVQSTSAFQSYLSR